MSQIFDTSSVDRTEIAKAVARSYGGDRDGWERLEEYQRVLDAAARHPEKGSSALASVVDLPRSRIRPWLDGGKPDPAHGVERAEERGWLDWSWSDPEGTATAVLVAWIFAGGSISRPWYRPRFSADGDLEMAVLEQATSVLGVSLERVDREHPTRGDELEPVDDASVFGRWLAALGAPIGEKANRTDLAVPAWLGDAPQYIRLAFARAYVINRGVTGQRRPSKTVTFQEERAESYLQSLRSVLASVVDAPEEVTLSGATILLGPRAAARLYHPPLVDGLLETGSWPPGTLLELLHSPLTPAEAFDHWGTLGFGFSRTEWGDRRGVQNKAVAHSFYSDRAADVDLEPADALPGPSDALVMPILCALCRVGCSPIQAIDYYFTAGSGGMTHAEWAEYRGVGEQTIKESIKRAREALDE